MLKVLNIHSSLFIFSYYEIEYKSIWAVYIDLTEESYWLLSKETRTEDYNSSLSSPKFSKHSSTSSYTFEGLFLNDFKESFSPDEVWLFIFSNYATMFYSLMWSSSYSSSISSQVCYSSTVVTLLSFK